MQKCTEWWKLTLFICYLLIQIVLTVAIAFIVEAFVLKIDLARQEYTSRKGCLVAENYCILLSIVLQDWMYRISK